jgi:hypothetical protein
MNYDGQKNYKDLDVLDISGHLVKKTQSRGLGLQTIDLVLSIGRKKRSKSGGVDKGHMKHKLGGCLGSHKVQKCCAKILYDTHDEAVLGLDRYLYRVLFSSMNVYKCFLHDGFHLGHDSRMSNSEILSQSQLAGKQLVIGGL